MEKEKFQEWYCSENNESFDMENFKKSFYAWFESIGKDLEVNKYDMNLLCIKEVLQTVSEMIQDNIIENEESYAEKSEVVKEVIGAITHDFNDWFFKTHDASFSADVVTALDELLGDDTSVGDKYKITIEKL